jgi:hypothetical protein
MVEALKKAKGNVKFTVYPEAGHDYCLGRTTGASAFSDGVASLAAEPMTSIRTGSRPKTTVP